MRFQDRLGTISMAVLVVVTVSCSSSVEGPAVVISDDGWSATPSSAAVRGGEFTVTVTNDTDTVQSFVVVTMCPNPEAIKQPHGNDPAALPMSDGLLDLSRDMLCGDPEQLGVALFIVVSGDYEHREGEGVTHGPMTPTTVEPGGEETVTIGGAKGGGEPGTYVVLSWEPGGHEAGDYAVFTITEP